MFNTNQNPSVNTNGNTGVDFASSKNRMTPQDIIKNSDEIKENGSDWKKAYAVIYKSIEDNTHRVFRNGNTLFWIHILAPGEAEMYIFNADTPRNFLRNMRDFAMAMHKSGYKRVFGTTHNVQILEVIKHLGFPVDIENAGTDEQGRQLYKGTVNV